MIVKEPETGAEEAQPVKEADLGPADQFPGPIKPNEPVLPTIKFPVETPTPVVMNAYKPKPKPTVSEMRVINPNKKPKIDQSPAIREHL